MPKPNRNSLALIAAACALLSACEAPVEVSYEDAQAAYDAGDMVLAGEHLVALIGSGKDDAQTRLLQARTMLMLGDGNRALLALEQLPEGALPAEEMRAMTAHAQILQGYAHRVAANYESLPDEDFTEEDFRMQLWAFRELDEGEDFDANIGPALERFPDSVAINTMAGLQLVENGQPFEAIDYAQIAYANAPESLDTLLLIGQIEIRRGDLEKALEYYELAHRFHPHHALPLANIAGLQLDLGEIGAAGETLDAALKDHPDFAFLNFQSARHLFETGNIEAARLAVEKARKSFADNIQFILLEARIEDKAGNAALAIDLYRLYLNSFGYHRDIEARIAELEAGATST
ncbi:tetratricopeptide repeat protein [uncultured Erythrobacter sp.]|uniref:tetratricopeptide repeat protein n=1 Tax=uncultured Erythrobacter sp. TaxID=263913 RepID=UPI002636F448|nr:tetratricopeptide repeat protein [uncultured Erythrobacter sp.]